jgi:hypothetical protein
MERDYIMRLIEQIAALVASIIAKERAGKYPEAKAEIDEKARQTIGLSLEQVAKAFSRSRVAVTRQLWRLALRTRRHSSRAADARR